MSARSPNNRKRILFIVTAVTTIVYLSWRIFFTLPFGFGLPSLFAGLLLLFCEILAGLEMIEQYNTMTRREEPEMPVLPVDWYPHVDVFVATHNETTDVLYKTLNACAHLDYPDKAKVHIHLCDDMDRPEMRELAAQFGASHLAVKNNKHAKAGNLNYALSQTNSPFVATFDADMMPRSTFLMESIPYFFLPLMEKSANGRWQPRAPKDIDPQKIGFIQTTQSFYNPDLFQYNLYAEQSIPNEQDYFSGELNIGRNRNNSPLYTGSNTIIAREALESVGGIATGSLTEDFETGLRIQALGYRTYAISKILSHGLAPHSIIGLIKQRDRWARGCVQSIRNVHLLTMRGLSFSAKISYLICLVYWWAYARMFVYVSMPILAVLFNFHVVECTLGAVLLFWLPYYILGDLSMKTLSEGVRTHHWNDLSYTILCPYMIMPVIQETLGFRLNKFIVTKKKTDGKNKDRYLALPHVFMLIVSFVALVVCLRTMVATASANGAILAFWLAINCKNFLFAIFFMAGRNNGRQADRFYVKLPVSIEFGGKTHNGVTSDISETGLAVILSEPVFLPDDTPFPLTVTTDKYRAVVQCMTAHVDPPAKKRQHWRYCFRIVDCDEANRRLYFQIVFDRMHTLPNKIMDALTVVDDLKQNIEQRLDVSPVQARRRLPRIPLSLPITTDSGYRPVMEDFSYKYVRLSGNWPAGTERFRVGLGEGYVLVLEPVPGRVEDGSGLFRVIGGEHLSENEKFMGALAFWAETAEERRKLMEASRANSRPAKTEGEALA